MPILTHPSFGPKMSLKYITVGSLAALWATVWLFTMAPPWAEMPPYMKFLIIGSISTGAILTLIGLFLGPIGQAARRAELPPADAVNKEVAIQHTAAAVPDPLMAAAAVPAGLAAPANAGVPSPAAPAAPAGQATPARR
jgi:hypothetical protein